VNEDDERTNPGAPEPGACLRPLSNRDGHQEGADERGEGDHAQDAQFQPHAEIEIVGVGEERHLDQERVARKRHRELIARADAGEREVVDQDEAVPVHVETIGPVEDRREADAGDGRPRGEGRWKARGEHGG